MLNHHTSASDTSIPELYIVKAEALYVGTCSTSLVIVAPYGGQ